MLQSSRGSTTTLSYHLSFNFFTELGVDKSLCGRCPTSLRRNHAKYNSWTYDVVQAIRATGGNNANRILILGSPEKNSDGLSYIDERIYIDDDYMMVEWHDYAAGPYKKVGRPRYWSGNGTERQRFTLRNDIRRAKEFTRRT